MDTLEKKYGKEPGIARRNFLKIAAKTAAGALMLSPGIFWLDKATAAIPASKGYLLVDTKKCQGCATCMMACSLVHQGEVNFSLSRIQVLQNPFEKWPHDIAVSQCRQCVTPACVAACPEGAVTYSAICPKQKGESGYNVNLRDWKWDRCFAPAKKKMSHRILWFPWAPTGECRSNIFQEPCFPL